MSFTRMNKNMNIICELADNPTETAAELKSKFDEGGLAVKNFLNNTVLPELDSAVSGLESDIETIQTDMRNYPAAVDNLDSDSALSPLSAKQGKVLCGMLSAKQNKISAGTASPSGGTDGDIYIKCI